jgi:5-oxoprolinase (ATP-hydrolysing)/N-methylhydantoinase A
MRKREDDGLPTLISVYPEGVNNPVDGLYGGQPGGEALGRLIDPQGNELHNVGSGQLVELRRADQWVELVLAGGSGYGSPRERSPDALARDLRLGLISPDATGHDYGQSAPTAGAGRAADTSLATT